MRNLLPLALLTALLISAEDLPGQVIEILTTNCTNCHCEALKLSNLDQRSHQSMLAGAECCSALEPGDAAKSRLYRFGAHLENPSMAPELPDWRLVVVRNWIQNDAPMPEGSALFQKSRGLLESTAVIWHGEFGRMLISQKMNGRDRHPLGFTIWMAGDRLKGGTN